MIEILRTGRLLHPPPQPHATGHWIRVRKGSLFSDNKLYEPTVICFCDIPTEAMDLHMSKYSRFGVAFPKAFLVGKGASPVFYVAKNSSLSSSLAEPRAGYFNTVSALVNDLAFPDLPFGVHPPTESPEITQWQRVATFLLHQVFPFVVFFDDSKADDDRDNYYMEREWRLLGNLGFDLANVSRVIVPHGYRDRFKSHLPEYKGDIFEVGDEASTD